MTVSAPAPAAVVFSPTLTAVLAALKVLGLDVVAWMVEGAAVDLWLDHARPLVVQASVVGGLDGGTDAGKTHKENLGFMVRLGLQWRPRL